MSHYRIYQFSTISIFLDHEFENPRVANLIQQGGSLSHITKNYIKFIKKIKYISNIPKESRRDGVFFFSMVMGSSF